MDLVLWYVFCCNSCDADTLTHRYTGKPGLSGAERCGSVKRCARSEGLGNQSGHAGLLSPGTIPNPDLLRPEVAGVELH
jgi:hypothetical protein